MTNPVPWVPPGMHSELNFAWVAKLHMTARRAYSPHLIKAAAGELQA